MMADRNQRGLTQREIEQCIEVWKMLDGPSVCGDLEVEMSLETCSKTVYDARKRQVVLGANVLPPKPNPGGATTHHHPKPLHRRPI